MGAVCRLTETKIHTERNGWPTAENRRRGQHTTKKYIDDQGWKYRVMFSFVDGAYKVQCQKPERHGDIGWKGLRAIPWRLTPEDAQADLERLAKAKGWKEWFGEHGMDSCGGSSPGR